MNICLLANYVYIIYGILLYLTCHTHAHACINNHLLLQMIAAPFAAGALFLPFPWCFISLLPAFAFGEMWIGVTMAVVVDIVPVLIQGSAIAVYLFIITVVGGNFNILVTAFVQAGLEREWALLITFPGLYMLSSLLFILTFFVLRCEIVKAQTNLFVNIVANSE